MRSTRRLPVSAGAALGVVALGLAVLGACTAGGTGADPAGDSASVAVDGTTASALPPGKYQTLPQPCVAVSADELKKLVPGATDYTGKESPTYDTDRRVGCSWQGATTDGTSRTLSIDFERVVSYNPSISDEVQAEMDFDRLATAASIPLSPAGTAAGTVSTPPPVPTGSGTAAGGAATGTGTATGTGSDGGSPDLLPRRLTDLGDAAFINDVLKSPATPAASRVGPRRDVSLVFRTANVVVSITYAQSAPRDGAAPDSSDLQKGARQVADELESGIER
ncbi:hypothetical protein [Actinacidiphila sp. ITFR-21]|uniref:hypothetical protein n=1 Tax=Actinacidiphila sp. ITFR-21 TaxID=3075199 RepID=UPI002889E45B|nr:hypothetical protein [Streptomyces sp. ITFR-21]WNI17148.1 hypothetical protein RLT57_17580 [Streptomyces sp. ITFR-21]